MLETSSTTNFVMFYFFYGNGNWIFTLPFDIFDFFKWSPRLPCNSPLCVNLCDDVHACVCVCVRMDIDDTSRNWLGLCSVSSLQLVSCYRSYDQKVSYFLLSTIVEAILAPGCEWNRGRSLVRRRARSARDQVSAGFFFFFVHCQSSSGHYTSLCARWTEEEHGVRSTVGFCTTGSWVCVFQTQFC